MATLVPDTHRLITFLHERGFTKQQAEGLTDALNSVDLDHLATKADIRDLEHTLRELELRMTIKLGALIAGGVAFLAFLKFFA